MVRPIWVAVACMAASGAAAQDVPVAHPASELILPANTGIAVALDQEVSSNDAHAGDQFGVTVTHDIVTPSGVVIPRGTHGTGEVTLRTGRGAYGKSGKMEITLRSIVIGGRTVALSGKYREEGEGKTGVTVAAIAVGGLVGGALVKGRPAVFEQGRELQGFTVDAVALRAAPPRQAAQGLVAAQAPYPVQNRAAASIPASPGTTYASYVPDTDGQSSAEIFRRRLAAAQPVRRANAQQGWTITD